MKIKLFILTILLTSITPAFANDAWIKVDANGNAIGGAIVCSVDVCGDSNSVYSRLTLQPGEKYILQFQGDRNTGNVAGISAENPNLKLKVDLETNKWTQTSVAVIPTTSNPINFKAVETVSNWNPLTNPSMQMETSTVTRQMDVTIKPKINEKENTDNNVFEQMAWSFNWFNISPTDWSNLLTWIESIWLQVIND